MQVNEKHVESIEINDENFMEIVEKTLASIKKQYKTKNTINIENSNINSVDKKNEKIENKKKKKYTRRFKILKYCLNQLKYNNISIDEFMKKSPLQTRPYQLPLSLDFINAVKLDKFDKLEELLEFPELLYSLCDSGANPLIPNNDEQYPSDLAKDIKLKSYLTVFTYNYSKKSTK